MPTIPINDFSDGLWIPAEATPVTEQPEFAVPAGALLRAENIEYLASGGVRGRRGSSKFNAVARPGPIVALERFYSAPDLSTRMPNYPALDVDVNVNEGAVNWQNTLGVVGGGETSVCNSYVGVAETFGLALYPRFDISNTIPPDATIQRIEVKIVRRVGFAGATTGFGSVKDKAITLRMGPMNAPTVTSVDKADTGTDWPDQAFESATYGGVLDADPLWGTPWFASDINDPSFRVEVRAEGFTADVVARIDAIELSIFLSSNIVKRFLVAHTDGGNINWETAAAGVFTPITGGSYPAPTDQPTAIHWPQKGRLFICDGLNALKAYNGEAIVDVFTDPTVGIPPRRGPYMVLHKSRIYATEPTELHYSVYASEVDDETKWFGDIHLNVSDDQGGIITGLASLGDVLVILKNTAVFAYLGDPLDGGGGQLLQIDDRGCVAPDSIAVTPFGIVYLGREGVFMTDGRTVTKLSRPVDPLFVGRTEQAVYEEARAVFFPRKQQYILKLSPLQSVAWVLQRLEIETTEGTSQKLPWAFVPTLPMNVGTTWPGSGDVGELYVGDLSGFVWLRDDGVTDDGSAINCVMRTREVQLSEDLRTGRIYQVRALARMSTAMVLQLKYEHATTAQILFAVVGTSASPAVFQELRQFVADTSVLGRYVSLLMNFGAGPDAELHRLMLDVQYRSARRWP